jgi:hypothetical protein
MTRLPSLLLGGLVLAAILGYHFRSQLADFVGWVHVWWLCRNGCGGQGWG